MDKFSASTTEKAFSEKIKSLIGEKNNKKIAVAFSGGVDSLALLLLCKQVLHNDTIYPVYINHKIRTTEEISEEIALNEENCCKLGLDLTVLELDENNLSELAKKWGTEAAARKLRYEKLQQFSAENSIDFIFTAHHKDDQVETVFMKLSKKTPVTSLRGISEVSGKIIRPLLGFSKQNLKEYVKNKGFHWSEDSTNTNNNYQRNKVRNVILPQFREKYKGADSLILQTRDLAISQCDGFTFDGDSIDLEVLNSLNKAKQYIVLYSMWDRKVGGLLSMKMIERVLSQCTNKTAFEQASGGIFCVADGKLFLVSEKENVLYSSFSTELKDGKDILDFKVSVKRDSSDLKALHMDLSKIEGKAFIRFPRIGDRVELSAGSKTVIKVLQDMQIPRPLRQRTPIIIDDKGVVAVFASVWGKKDRLAKRFLEADYKNLSCITFTCRNK